MSQTQVGGTQISKQDTPVICLLRRLHRQLSEQLSGQTGQQNMQSRSYCVSTLPTNHHNGTAQVQGGSKNSQKGVKATLAQRSQALQRNHYHKGFTGRASRGPNQLRNILSYKKAPYLPIRYSMQFTGQGLLCHAPCRLIIVADVTLLSFR